VCCEVVGFGGGEGGVGGRVVEGVGVEGGAGEEGEGVGVDLPGVLATLVFDVFGSVEEGIAEGEEREEREERGEGTLAMRARRKERTRNLKRSSSVCRIMRVKLALGSMSPVCVSTRSI